METKIGYKDLNYDLKVAVIGSYVYIFFLMLALGLLILSILFMV